MTSSKNLEQASRRPCEGCGVPLLGTRARRFCSPRCRARAHRVSKAQKAKVILRKLKSDIAELEKLVGHE